MNVVTLEPKGRKAKNINAVQIDAKAFERLNRKAANILEDGLELMMAIERGIEKGDEWELLSIATQIRERRASLGENQTPIAVYATAQAIVKCALDSCGAANETSN